MNRAENCTGVKLLLASGRHRDQRHLTAWAR